jgi:hypothetical protein
VLLIFAIEHYLIFYIKMRGNVKSQKSENINSSAANFFLSFFPFFTLHATWKYVIIFLHFCPTVTSSSSRVIPMTMQENMASDGGIT